MKKSEVVKLFSVLSAAYPRFDRFSATTPTMTLWYELLPDIEFNTATVAIKQWILAHPEPPTIADIRRQTAALSQNPATARNASEAWGEVMHGIKRYGLYQSQQAYQTFSPLTAQVVRSIGWRTLNLCDEKTLSVLRGQFFKMYGELNEQLTVDSGQLTVKRLKDS